MEEMKTVRFETPGLTEDRLVYYKLGQISGILEKYSAFSNRSMNELKAELVSDKGIQDLLSVFRIIKGIK